MVLGHQHLQPAPAAAVAGDDDLAPDADAQALERLVVVGHAVVDVDDGGGDIAVALVEQIARQAPALGPGGGVALDRRLAQAGLEGLGALELQGLGDRGGVIDLEGLDVGLPAEGLELGQLPLGIGLVVGRADVVGFGRHALQPLADLGGMDLGVQARTQSCLGIVGRQRRAAGQQRHARHRRQPMPHHPSPSPNFGQQGTQSRWRQGSVSRGRGMACPRAGPGLPAGCARPAAKPSAPRSGRCRADPWRPGPACRPRPARSR